MTQKKLILVTLLCISSAITFAAFEHRGRPALSVSTADTKITDQEKHEFSLTIRFHLNRNTSKQWAIGFYMPRSYLKLGKDINPNLTINLSKDNSDFSQNLYSKKESKKHKIYSAGYTTVLAPKKRDTQLTAGNYTLTLNNNNQFPPTNISSMPQHLFIADHHQGKPLFYQAIIPAGAYHIGGYNQAKVNADIKQHNQLQIQQSLPLDSNNPSNTLNLVPQPKKIKFLTQAGFNVTHKNHAQINLTNNNRIKNPEGYRLTITDKGIRIAASTKAGAFYAQQTLHQLYFYAQHHNNTIPALDIYDAPRFKYRGVLLDLARHYLSINEIKHFINLMAAQKLNTLHIHFADDEGWRLAIPVATHQGASNALKVNAQRRGFSPTSSQPAMMFQQANLDKSNYSNQTISSAKPIIKKYPNATTLYQDTLSRNQVTALIKYANTHQITIIPEIDLPGHARALVKSLSAFQNSKDKSKYLSVQGYYDDVVPVCKYGRNNAFSYQMNDIIKSISQWFAGQTTVYAVANEVSVGGDEVSDLAWTQDKTCKNTLFQKLSALEKSHLFFQYLQQNTQIKLSGWQQSVQPLTDNSVVAANTAHIWVWEPTTTAIKDATALLNANYPTVLAFADDTYFDLTYSPDQWEPGFSWATSYSNTYATLKIAADSTRVTTSNKNRVLGIEGTLWSENINNYRHLIYMAVPKITGLAEAAWSPASKTTDGKRVNWLSLTQRLGHNNKQHRFLDFLQQNYLGKYHYRQPG